MYKTAKARLACVALTVALALGSMPMAAWGLDEKAQAFDSASAGPVITPVLTDDGQAAEPAAAEPAVAEVPANADAPAAAEDAAPNAEAAATDPASQDAEAAQPVQEDASQADPSDSQDVSKADPAEKPQAAPAEKEDASQAEAPVAAEAAKDAAVTKDAQPQAAAEADSQAAASAAASIADDEAAAVPMLLAAPALQGIQVGGSVFLSATGSDDADGLTAATAVKSFEKAKEILGAKGAEIRLLSTITIASDETWELADGQMVIRDDSFTSGPMIHVNPGAAFTAKNIVIDGGFGTTNQGVSGSSKYGKSAAIIDAYGAATPSSKGTATINLESGTVLRNNNVTSKSSNGGAIFASAYKSGVISADVNLNGATIENCTTTNDGGAIALQLAGTKAQIANSTITNCSAGVSGGALSVEYGAEAELTDGSVISNCSAQKYGGAVFVTTHFSNPTPSIFTQENATIKDCTAGTAGGGVLAQASSYKLREGGVVESCVSEGPGGGIFLDSGAVGLVAGTIENPIYIRNNTSKATNPDENGDGIFGGGGIYVNGGANPSRLILGEAVVRNNSAAVDGGGVAYCPQGGRYESFYEDATAIYGNSTDTGHSDDLAIVRNGTVTADGYTWTIGNTEAFELPNLSSTALGGVAYRWVGPDGIEYSLSDLMAMDDFFGKSSIQEGTAADSLANVFIEGNSAASFGGGIACNGSVVYPVKMPAITVQLEIIKKWAAAEGVDLPESVRMWVVRSDGEKVGFVDVKPGDDGTWYAKVEGLTELDKDGNLYTYTVEEEVVAGDGGTWKPSIDVTVDGRNNATATVTNTLVVNIGVEKVWVGGTAGPVTVTLLANGVPVEGATLQLSDANAWKAAFADLPKYDADGKLIAYSIVEGEVDGYSSSISGSAADGFTVTNKKNDEPEGPTPGEPEEPEGPTPGEPEEPKAPKSEQPEAPKPAKPEQVVYEGSVVPATGDNAPIAAGFALVAGALSTAFVARRRFQQ